MRPFPGIRAESRQRSRFDPRIGRLLLLMLLVMGLQAVTVPPDSQGFTQSQDAQLLSVSMPPVLAQVDQIGTELVTTADHSVALHAPHLNLPPDDSAMDDDDGSDSSTDFNFGSLVTHATMLALPLR